MATTPVISSLADKICATAFTATYLMAGFQSVSSVLEIGLFRGIVDPILKPLAGLLQKHDSGDNTGSPSWALGKVWTMIDIREGYKDQTSRDLFKNAVRYFVIAVLIKEATDRIFGPPIQGFNLIGNLIGVQILPVGLHFPAVAAWKNFFVPAVSAV